MNEIAAVKVERNTTYDVMKGISIILMVAGHTYNSIYHDFIYLFHVAAFYILSGICFKDIYTDDLKSMFSLLKKRIISLWLPYFCYNFVFLCLQNFFIKCGLLTSSKDYFLFNPFLSDGYSQLVTIGSFFKILLKSVFFINSRPFVGGLWFLGGLFYVTFMFACIQYILKKIHLEKLHILVSFIFLVVGYNFKKNGYIEKLPILKQVSLIFITEILFTVGFYLSKVNISNFKKVIYLPVLIVSFTILLISSKYFSISIAGISIINPIAYILYSVVGYFLLFSFAELLKTTKIEKILIYIGRHTVPILALHTLFFKLVTLIQVIYYKSRTNNVNDVSRME